MGVGTEACQLTLQAIAGEDCRATRTDLLKRSDEDHCPRSVRLQCRVRAKPEFIEGIRREGTDGGRRCRKTISEALMAPRWPLGEYGWTARWLLKADGSGTGNDFQRRLQAEAVSTPVSAVIGQAWGVKRQVNRRGLHKEGSGRARSRSSVLLNWFCQGQMWGKCRVSRRALRVRRPAMEKKRRRRVLAVTIGSPRPMRVVQRSRLCAITWTASQAALAGKRPEGRRLRPTPCFNSRMAFSTSTWRRWSASRSRVLSSRSVMKA